MKLLFPGQSFRLQDVVSVSDAPLVKLGPGSRDAQDRYIRVAGQESPGPPEMGGPFERIERAIMGYRIYPLSLLKGQLPNASIQSGDTLALRMALPLGFGLGFGTRVQSAGRTESEGWVRGGFSYTTLQGHPELGEAWFWVEKETATGLVRIHLHSWSRPGNLFARLGRPLARRMQIKANQSALDNLEIQGRL